MGTPQNHFIQQLPGQEGARRWAQLSCVAGSPRSETDPWFNYLIVKILSLYFSLQAVTFPKESWCLVSEGPSLSQGTLLITCPSCTDCISLEGCLGFGPPQALWHQSPRAENWWFQVLSLKLTRMACPLD